MKTLRVKCIICQKEWGKETTLSWGEDDISSSLCCKCFKRVATKLIRKKQLREGNFDCFGTAVNGECDQLDCKYKKQCLCKE